MGVIQTLKDRIALKDRNTERLRVLLMAFYALLFAWNVFDDHGKARYLAAAGVALFTFLAAWSFVRYRQQYRFR